MGELFYFLTGVFAFVSYRSTTLKQTVVMSNQTNSDSSIEVLDYSMPCTEYGEVGKVQKKTGKRKQASTESELGRIHGAVKGKAFDLVLGGENIDFRRASISARLLIHDTGKPVETRTVDPLGYSVRPHKSGESCSVEVRIAVLTSQMEGSLFSVEFSASSKGSEDGHNVTCVTEPIKVVSKKSQLEKSAPKRSRTTQVATRDAVLSLITKIEDKEEHTDGLLGEIARQNDRIISLLGAHGGGKRSFVSSAGFLGAAEEEDSASVGGTSGLAEVRTSALLAELAARVASDRSLVVNTFSSLSSSDKQVLFDFNTQTQPAYPSSTFASPPPTASMPISMPDFRAEFDDMDGIFDLGKKK